MRKLKVKFLWGSFLKLLVLVDTELILSFRIGSFRILISIFNRQVWKLMGICRLHVYYKKRYIFHWCDLCVIPKIGGVNLGTSRQTSFDEV